MAKRKRTINLTTCAHTDVCVNISTCIRHIFTDALSFDQIFKILDVFKTFVCFISLLLTGGHPYLKIELCGDALVFTFLLTISLLFLQL